VSSRDVEPFVESLYVGSREEGRKAAHESVHEAVVDGVAAPDVAWRRAA
jgi:hypothetical protein